MVDMQTIFNHTNRAKGLHALHTEVQLLGVVGRAKLLFVALSLDYELLDRTATDKVFLGDLDTALWTTCLILCTDEYKMETDATHERRTLRTHPHLTCDYIVAHNTLPKLILVKLWVHWQSRFLHDTLNHFLFSLQSIARL
jgi:hypothetical protein